MKSKIITVIIPILLIFIIAGGVVGLKLREKYSYSTEQADMAKYFKVTGNQCAIILQDEMIEEKALVKNEYCYLDIDTVHKYLNDTFYWDAAEELLLYTDALETTGTVPGTKSCTDEEGEESLPYETCFLDGDTLYIAMDYVLRFTDYEYTYFGDHLQLTTAWGTGDVAEIEKDTQIRLRGGVKSPVLRELAKGEKVKILEMLENWCKIKTSDSIIGYVEIKKLGEIMTDVEDERPTGGYKAPEYADLSLGKKVSLGWHSIGGVGGNSTLDSVVAKSKGMNIIAPTWFSLNDNEGGFRSFGEASYVEKAHAYGLQVWGVWDDFNYQNETGERIDKTAILSSTTKRTALVQSIVDTAVSLGLDGVNLDFEKIGSDCYEHFGQFLRELSVACHKQDLYFSVDNYMPNAGNKQYRMDVQGKVADYVILMGYDEHWHGSKEPGSVASIGFVTEGIEKSLKSVAAHKLVNALPFYTIVWTINGVDVSDEYLTMANTAEFRKNHSEEIVWDETTCQNYLEWTTSGGDVTHFVWLEDAESIRVKLNVMNANNLAGVAVWQLEYGTEVAWELINAYVNS